MKNNKMRFIAGASALAVVAATPALIDVAGQHIAGSRLAAHGFTAETIRVSLGGVEMLGVANDRVRIGRLTGPSPFAGLMPAFAQSSGYTIENLALTVNTAKIDVPRLVVNGANVEQNELPKLLAFDSNLSARLRGFSASSISAPEVRISASFPEAEKVSYILRDVAADEITNGRIARLSNGGVTFSTGSTAPAPAPAAPTPPAAQQGKPPSAGSFFGGAISAAPSTPAAPTAPAAPAIKGVSQNGSIRRAEVRGLDLAQVAHVYFNTAGADEKPATVYESYVAEGMISHVRSTAEINMEIGTLSSNGVRARALKGKSLETVVGELIAHAKARAADPQRKADQKDSLRIFGMMREVFSAVEDDGISAQSIKFLVGEKASPYATVDIAKVEGTYGNANRSAGFRVAGVSFKGPDMTGKVDEYAIEGFSYAPTFEAMAQAIEAGDEEFKNVDPRKLIPKLGTTTVRGLEFDVPEPKAPKGIKPERVHVKLGTFSTAASDQLNGIPTKLTITIDNLAVRLPQNSADAGIQTLKTLGYSSVDFSSKLAATWNEATREVAISELSLGGVDMGRARISAVLGNFGREIFEGDRTMAQVALMGATAKSLNLEINNTGLAERALAFQARQQNSKPEDIRRELGTAAALGIPAMLGPSDDAKAIAAAVSRFVTRPKTLKIELTAKNAAGIGIPDIVTVGSPDNALKLVNVKANASD